MTRSNKQKDNLEKLTSLGIERLAKMLLERADWDEDTARAVEQALAESAPLEEVMSKVKRGLGLYTDSRLAGAWGKSSVISKELEHLRVLIVESVLPKAPDTAAGLLEKLIDRHVPVFNNVDDSYGVLGDVFRQVVRDWGNACARTSGKKAKGLAGMVYKRIMTNDYGMYDKIVSAFGAALGEEGLAQLEKLVRQELSHLPAVHGDEDRRGLDERWRRRLPLCHTLEEIADLRRDPDAYIEAVSLLGKPEAFAGEIAERLISGQRFEEALEWLGKSERMPRHDIAGLKARCLVALGRKAEARGLLWQDFLQTLSGSSYAGARELTPEEETEKQRRDAIETAKKHSSALTALSFLLKQGFMPDAAALVVNRWKELGGEHYYTLRPAAEKLEIDFPLAAVLLRRRLVEATLEKGQSKYYEYAVGDLKEADRISRKVKDWGDIEDQEQFLHRLKERHGKKSSFWSRYA